MTQSRGALQVIDLLCIRHRDEFSKGMLRFLNRHGNEAKRENAAIGRTPRGPRSDDAELLERIRAPH
jgi:hypothetical protein